MMCPDSAQRRCCECGHGGYTSDEEAALEYPDLWLERAKQAVSALTTMTGEGADQHYTGVYERAGGGYEGLQAIARAALADMGLAARGSVSLPNDERPQYVISAEERYRADHAQAKVRDLQIALREARAHIAGLPTTPARDRAAVEAIDAALSAAPSTGEDEG